MRVADVAAIDWRNVLRLNEELIVNRLHYKVNVNRERTKVQKTGLRPSRAFI